MNPVFHPSIANFLLCISFFLFTLHHRDINRNLASPSNPDHTSAMAPPSKAAESRRKSGSKSGLLVTLTVSPSQLRELIQPEPVKEETPVEESKENESPANSATPAVPAIANGETASDSNAATPAADGTPAPSAMGPPTEGAKKKGTKRSAAAADTPGDGTPKPRGKPGPKKKPRLEDGTIDHNNVASRASGAHKLGPKANQGAINAGLRALDRSGKPCRKWARGGFTLKSFTGVVWEIPRWTAPPRKATDSEAEGSAEASAEGSSSKENKENGPEPNSTGNSNSGADVEMQSAPSANAPSPAPLAIAAAS
ncbi:INO80 complex subunit [Paramyrothecium foliicola]|nr:INO80 complex subunit [Paramyrothecium foliicola]